MKNLPLLEVGTFGTHLTKNPSGTFSFVGTVPECLSSKTYDSYETGLNEFFNFIDRQNTEWKREYVPSLRNDIFQIYLNRAQQ